MVKNISQTFLTHLGYMGKYQDQLDSAQTPLSNSMELGLDQHSQHLDVGGVVELEEAFISRN